MKQSANNIRELKAGEIFVFGSNLAGLHGAGAALFAYKNLWAKWGKGYGLWRDPSSKAGSYAIPTKGLNIETIPLDWIKYYVKDFCRYVKSNPQFNFLITEIGCGLAGYTPEEIAPMFKSIADLPNVYLPEKFIVVIYDMLIHEDNS